MQKLLSIVKRWLIKAPPPLRLHCKTMQPASALLTCLKIYAAAFVSVVSACCLVHFLTLVSNLSKKSNNEYSAQFVSVVAVRVDTVCGVRFSCILVVSCICPQSYNLSTTLPNKFAKIFY